MAAIFGAAAKNAVTGDGAPSYTSGVHMWNGTAESLNARPVRTNTNPKISATEWGCAFTDSAICENSVEPV
jgi:hypothetical protein